MTPRICIIGRPNVGKSALFNRLVGLRKSLVHNEPGVTRDRLEKEVTWYHAGIGYSVVVVDTGGLGEGAFHREIQRQVEHTLHLADVALFVLDAQEGVTDQDRAVFALLRKKGVTERMPVVGVLNKLDTPAHDDQVGVGYELGLESVYGVSAEHDRGVESLKERIIEILSELGKAALVKDKALVREPVASIAIVGRPNVGKSSLFNALAREERSIISDIPGTTVDAVDTVVRIGNDDFLFVDTAGIRRKAKTRKGVDVLSVLQARKALERADLALLVIDGKEGVTDQDEKIGGLVMDAGCSVVLVVNKWDLQKNNRDFDRKEATNFIRRRMRYLSFAPIVFVSALERKGLEKIPALLGKLRLARDMKLETHEFTEFVRNESPVHNPKNAKFLYCHQASRHPPTFVCHVNDPQAVHFSLERHLVNAIRDRWGFVGCPVRMVFVQAASTR